jgi:hypothetical protein
VATRWLEVADMTSAQAWLADEVLELLRAGSVGLYELIESLQQSDYWSTADEARRISKDVVIDLANRGLVSICLLRWPKDDVIDGPLPITLLDEGASWQWLPTNLYFALIPQPHGGGGDR